MVVRGASAENPILRINSLSLRHGEFIGIVGPLGGGKTTFLKLLMKQIDPEDSQSIVIRDYVDADGVRHSEKPLAEIDTGEWHEVVSMMYQHYPEMEGLTVRQVVTLGKEDINAKRFDAVAKVVDLHDGIVGTDSSWEDLRIGQRLAGGRDFSGGQRNAMALVRAVGTSDKPLLLLDEPGSKSDPASEHKMIKELQRVAKDFDLTLIVISHRYGTILKADKIVVISDGAIEAVGTHESLLDQSSTYRDGWRIQVESLLPGGIEEFERTWKRYLRPQE